MRCLDVVSGKWAYGPCPVDVDPTSNWTLTLDEDGYLHYVLHPRNNEEE